MYTPLYIKTNNSLLTSMIKIDELVSFAKKNKIKALTITDNNMYGVMEFYKTCIKESIKPIIEIYSVKEEVPLENIAIDGLFLNGVKQENFDEFAMKVENVKNFTLK